MRGAIRTLPARHRSPSHLEEAVGRSSLKHSDSLSTRRRPGHGGPSTFVFLKNVSHLKSRFCFFFRFLFSWWRLSGLELN